MGFLIFDVVLMVRWDFNRGIGLFLKPACKNVAVSPSRRSDVQSSKILQFFRPIST